MFKRISLLILCVLFMLPFNVWADEEINLLKNPGFEELDEASLPLHWTTDAYIKRVGVSQFSTTEAARTGEHAAVVQNFDMNDARYAQTVPVEPSSIYRLSGWIRATDILDAGHGANLSIADVYVFSSSVYDTDDEWVYIETYGRTADDQTEVTIFVRVGGYSGESQGSAAFDDISLVKVDSIPEGASVSPWYTVKVTPVTTQNDDFSIKDPFWPWLIAIASLYALAAFWLMRYLQTRELETASALRMMKSPCALSGLTVAGIVLACLTRIIVALKVEGYQVDVGCFVSWGSTMASVGPSMFYQTTTWCDYTPAYLYVLGLNGHVAGLLGNFVAPIFVHKLVPICCDLLSSVLIYRLAVKHEYSRRQAGILAGLFAFNPATFLNSAAWCQIDSVLCLGLMLVAYFAIQRKWHIVLPVYVLCILIKPQALMLGFLGLAAIVSELVAYIVHAKEENTEQTKEESDAPKSSNPFKRFLAVGTKNTASKMLLGLGLALLTALIIIAPFCPNQKSAFWLIDLYKNTLKSYNHATVNTANIFYLAGANWADITLPASSGVIIFFAVFVAVWAGYTAWRQKQKMYLWYIEPALMAAYALLYLVLLFAGCTWSTLGWATMSMAFVIVSPMFVRSRKLENLPLCGAVIFLLLYVFGVKMHERYLFPAIFLLGMAYALRRDRRIFALLIGTSCVLFINEGVILDNSLRLGSAQGHLLAENRTLGNFLSVLNIAFTMSSVWLCHLVCVEDCSVKLSEEAAAPLLPIKQYKDSSCAHAKYSPDAKLGITLRDTLIMLVVTVIYAVVSLTTLGSTKAPQNPWKSSTSNEIVYIDLGQHYDDFSMLYFCQVSYNHFYVAVNDTLEDDGWSKDHPAQMAEGQCFQWKYLTPSYTSNGTPTFVSASTFADVQKLSGRYVRITSNQVGLIINELVFKDAEGNVITGATVINHKNANAASPLYSEPFALLDEQNTLDGEPSWWNSTYFDEIYHARTAYELLNDSTVYEWTHPPLGKIIMSWFIGIFGMTPFGWRFAGAFCGVLMLPAIYLLTKQLTKRSGLASVAMLLMALDCMHFTQTRIATIDSFPVLFIILSYFFMLRFMQRDITVDKLSKILPDLAFSGFFMGCGVASKWIGIYAGLGLAVLYFWTCLRHIRLDKMKRLNRPDNDARCNMQQKAFSRVVVLCLWCLLFFVLIPVSIYLLSYADRFADREVGSLLNLIKMIISETEGMLSYHGTPGLGMDHTFYSPWYEWPLMITPMYYASASFKPEGMTYAIFCFGNPWVWCIGLVGIAFTVYLWGKGHRYQIAEQASTLHLWRSDWDIAPAFVLIGLLAQFLPWVLVPRGTYIYHYFASIPFLILGTILLLDYLVQHRPHLGKWICIIFLGLCFVWFVLLFPYASGLPAPNGWMDFIRDYPYISYTGSDFSVWLSNLLNSIPILPNVYHH